MSITGQTTFFRFSLTRAKSGSNHPIVHSQCASKNVNTSPVALFAPRSLAAMIPSRFGKRNTLVRTGKLAT